MSPDLDPYEAGVGIDVAVQMSELGIEPRNAVRFAIWGTEESGLIGLQFSIDSLTRQQRN